ncbi:MAG: hypothetical protein IPL26_18310 [Leptospiraceae bacterium]|nr:hypothetical protein [Leptospiraceae bacterium]
MRGSQNVQLMGYLFCDSTNSSCKTACNGSDYAIVWIGGSSSVSGSSGSATSTSSSGGSGGSGGSSHQIIPEF